MNVPASCDVVVIGGGPAGSTVASLLSQKGYDVAVFDKARHPRYTVGESLIPHFWKYCELTGSAAKVDAERFIRKAGGTVVWGGVIRQMQFADFGYTRPALHVERDRFDEILLRHAQSVGVQVFEEIAILAADLNGGERVKVRYRPTADKVASSISCRFVVDASGQSAVMSRQLGVRVLDDGFRFMSLWGYFKDSKYIAADGRAYPFERLRDVPPTTFVSDVGGWGWAWHIPQRESTSVGLVIPQNDIKGVKGTEGALEAYFLRRCFEVPYLNRLLEQAQYLDGSLHVVRDYSYRPTSLAGPGYFLIGDAAAFIDPIFSIGVVLAMYSAGVAAWAIDRSMQDPSTADDSQRIYARQVRARMEASRALALPRDGYCTQEGEMVRTSLEFETPLEQELMYVVSSLTTRSENFAEMVGESKRQDMSSSRFKVLDTLEI